MDNVSLWQQALHEIRATPGDTCSEPQVAYLYRLSRETRGEGEIVEVGTNVGRTAMGLALGQKEADGKPIYTVDIYEHPDVATNLERVGVSDFVHRIVSDSTKAAADWQKPIALLWLDGDHSCAGTTADIRAWARHVIPGGLVALHDYPGHMGSSEVWRAASRTLTNRPREWQIVSDREVGSIFVLRKLDNPAAAAAVRQRPAAWIYWRGRDLRAFIFRWFPKLSSGVVQAIKGRSK